MNVHCPTCDTGYEIPPLLRPRRLRCTHCAAEWRELPPDAPADVPLDVPAVPEPAPAPELVAVSQAAPAAELRLASPLSTWPGRRALVLWAVLWALSLLLVAGCLFALWHWRDAVGHRWPPSLRLYRLISGVVPYGKVPR